MSYCRVQTSLRLPRHLPCRLIIVVSTSWALPHVPALRSGVAPDLRRPSSSLLLVHRCQCPRKHPWLDSTRRLRAAAFLLIKLHLSTVMSTSNIPCRYWVSQGRCFFGSDCKYLHTSHNANHAPSGNTATSKPVSSIASSASASLASAPVSRASNRASFRPLAILSDDGQPVVQQSASADQVDSGAPVEEQMYQMEENERQPATIYSGGDYHSPLPQSNLANSIEQPSAGYTAADTDSGLLDSTAALSLYDPATASNSPYTVTVPGPASGLPPYPTQPSGHISLPARSLASSQSTAAQSPSPQFLFADNSGLAVQSQPQRSFFMNETLRERLLFHQQLVADRLEPEGQHRHSMSAQRQRLL